MARNATARNLPTLTCTILLVGCAASPDAMGFRTEAAGSPYFSVGAPTLYKSGDTVRVAGRVCRVGRTILLSPHAVRIEQLSAQGEVLAATSAKVRAIGRSYDQACVSYGARLNWRLEPDQSLRACVDRAKACSAPTRPQTSAPRPASQ